MGKIIFDILEDDFNRKSSPVYELSILTGIDSFTYMVSDGQQNILALREHLLEDAQVQELEETIAGDRMLSLSYRNCRIIWSGPVSTLVPTRLFNPADRESLLEHLTELPDDMAVKYDQISQLNATNVYGISAPRLDVLNKKFPGARLFHLHSALYWGYRKFAGQQGGMQIFLHVRQGYCSLLLFEGPNLLIANRYDFQAGKDLLYFVLLIFDQFKLSQENTPVFLSGKLLDQSEIYQLLIRYIRKVQFLQPPAFFQFGPKLNQKKHYLYFDLFCGLLCK